MKYIITVLLLWVALVSYGSYVSGYENAMDELQYKKEAL